MWEVTCDESQLWCRCNRVVIWRAKIAILIDTMPCDTNTLVLQRGLMLIPVENVEYDITCTATWLSRAVELQYINLVRFADALHAETSYIEIGLVSTVCVEFTSMRATGKSLITKSPTSRTHGIFSVIFAALLVFIAFQGSLRLSRQKKLSIRANETPFRASAGCGAFELRHEVDGRCRALSTILSGAQNIYFVNPKKASYMYCAIPKNGCTYHYSLLHRVQFEMWTLKGVEIHTNKSKNTLHLGYLPDAKISDKLADVSIPKYVIVRNPLTRTLSGYRDKFEKYIPAEEQTAGRFHEWVKEEFPPYSPRNVTVKYNVHWRPQLRYCGFRYPQIYQRFTMLRFEEPHKYVEFLYKHIPRRYLDSGWGDGSQSFREASLAPVYTRTGNTNELFYEYFSTLEIFDYLADILKEDIDFLGYRRDVEEMRKELEKKVARTKNADAKG